MRVCICALCVELNNRHNLFVCSKLPSEAPNNTNHKTQFHSENLLWKSRRLRIAREGSGNKRKHSPRFTSEIKLKSVDHFCNSPIGIVPRNKPRIKPK